MRFAPVVKPDPPSLFCVGPCRSWVKTSERPRFIKTGGTLAPWLCPKCRPEGRHSGYPEMGSSVPKEVKGLQHNFEAIGGRRKGRPGRPSSRTRHTTKKGLG